MTSLNNFKEVLKEFKSDYIKINGSNISFQIQDGPIKEVGVNGCQIDELGRVWGTILRHFNRMFSCKENSKAITHIDEALLWQIERRDKRIKRGVEGYNKG